MTRNILLLSLVAFVGCTKVEREEVPAAKVTFTVGSYAAQTKADQGSGVSLLSETTTFHAKAYMHGAGMDGYTLYFGENGEDISYTGTVNATDPAQSTPGNWAPAHDYFWPTAADSYIDFICWYDKNSAPAVTYAADADGKYSASMKWSSREIAADDNILFADMAWHQKDNNDDKAQTWYYLNGVQQGVPTLFRHALSKVTFKVLATTLEATNPDTRYNVTVTDFKVSGLYSTGALELTNSDPKDDDPSVTVPSTKVWSGGWSIPTGSTAVDRIPASLTPMTLTTSAQAVSGLDETTILPQSLAGVKLTIIYNIALFYSSNTSDTPNVEEEIGAKDILLYDPNGTGFSNTISSWEMNKKYTYTISINPVTNVIKFAPVIPQDWTPEIGLPID